MLSAGHGESSRKLGRNSSSKVLGSRTSMMGARMRTMPSSSVDCMAARQKPTNHLAVEPAVGSTSRPTSPVPPEEVHTPNAAIRQVPEVQNLSRPSSSPPCSPRLGSRIELIDKGHRHSGIIEFVGCTKFAEGTWIGIALDKPVGKNDGSAQGVEYFRCPPKHGLFVRKGSELIARHSLASSATSAGASAPGSRSDASFSVGSTSSSPVSRQTVGNGGCQETRPWHESEAEFRGGRQARDVEQVGECRGADEASAVAAQLKSLQLREERIEPEFVSQQRRKSEKDAEMRQKLVVATAANDRVGGRSKESERERRSESDEAWQSEMSMLRNELLEERTACNEVKLTVRMSELAFQAELLLEEDAMTAAEEERAAYERVLKERDVLEIAMQNGHRGSAEGQEQELADLAATKKRLRLSMQARGVAERQRDSSEARLASLEFVVQDLEQQQDLVRREHDCMLARALRRQEAAEEQAQAFFQEKVEAEATERLLRAELAEALARSQA
eukprot:TRINITY_DN22696_c0_g1_i1.p1 TRINITY_DN22696_c0_g1~~TRINITY_DN22696_c0_g1_i1.p1  ORF type:complete len:503 (-),score=103.27 TRINITY_DN22696_c0_g1_i1:119-1627(-)